jgi:predicted PurR-regulated permease PerM
MQRMSRFVSLIVLLASIVVIGALFYKVMIGFFVPVFLAAVLVIVFRPMHRWVLEKVGKREHVAAGITTSLIIFSVLIPAALLLALGAIQGTKLIGGITPSTISLGLNNARKSLGLDSPAHAIIQAIQKDIDDIQTTIATMSTSQVQDPKGAFRGLDRKVQKELDELLPTLATHHVNDVKAKVRQAREDSPVPDEFDASAIEAQLQEIADTQYKDTAAVWVPTIQKVKEALTKLESSDIPDVIELRGIALQLGTTWQSAKETLLGGRSNWFGNSVWATFTELANPSDEQIATFTKSAIGYLQPTLISATSATAEFIVKLILGAVIMIVSMYFFIVDGPGMIESVMKLSPLDDRYEMELLTEFDRISRAIVLAMIFSAIVQGLTAGIGYYFAGMSSLLLLTLLSILAGLIPFVGPGVVWIPVCIYLSVYLGEPTTAVMLALWGVLAVGSVDNVVKAYVLHGQSQLHPLLALLSVLGGVTALGPIGIVVGPIVVVLLQTLLVILRRELVHLDSTEGLAAAGAPVSISPSAAHAADIPPEVESAPKFAAEPSPIPLENSGKFESKSLPSETQSPKDENAVVASPLITKPAGE